MRHEFLIQTPTKDKISIFLVSESLKIKMIKNEYKDYYGKCKKLFLEIPIFTNGNGKFILDYDNYGVEVDNLIELELLFFSPNWFPVIFHIHNIESMNYMYECFPTFITEYFQKNAIKHNHSLGHNRFKINFEDGSFSVLTQRTKDLYQGSWFADELNFNYFFDNQMA